VTSSVLEVRTLLEKITWSYTVTWAINRLVYFSRYMATFRQVFNIDN